MSKNEKPLFTETAKRKAKKKTLDMLKVGGPPMPGEWDNDESGKSMKKKKKTGTDRPVDVNSSY